MKRFFAIAGLILPLALQAKVLVKVLPNPAEVKPAGAVQFKAEVTDSSGKLINTPIEWNVAPDKLGKIGPDGIFLAANHEGKGIVRAEVKTKEGKAVGHSLIRVEKESEQEMAVRIMPKHCFMKQEESKQFEVKVIGPDGEPITDAHLVFKVVPQDVGSITQEGMFTAGKEYGKCKIVVLAKKGDLECTGEAVVVIGDPEKYLPIKIVPPHTVIKPGETQKFSFEILGPKPEAESEIKWQVTPKELGIITQDGIFTAGEKEGKGAVQIMVKVGDKVGIDRAIVIVGKPGETRVKIYPRKAVIEPNRTFKFYARIFDKEGNPLDLPVKWLVNPKEAGTITEEGLFTADGKAGKCEVVALIPPEFGMGKDVANVIVQKKLVVRISPRSAIVEPKKMQRFEAKVFNLEGNPVEVPVEWAVAPKEAGTIENGVFTAEKAGKCEVIAFIAPKFGFGRDVASVVVHRELKVKIIPEYAKVQVNKTWQFNANIFDAEGNRIEDIPLNWKVEPSAGGTITETGLFTASSTPGKYRVVVLIESPAGVGKGIAVVDVVQ